MTTREMSRLLQNSAGARVVPQNLVTGNADLDRAQQNVQEAVQDLQVQSKIPTSSIIFVNYTLRQERTITVRSTVKPITIYLPVNPGPDRQVRISNESSFVTYLTMVDASLWANQVVTKRVEPGTALTIVSNSEGWSF